ncbi:MAG: hypothetical protein WAM17_07285 [Rhodoplanes sp.]
MNAHFTEAWRAVAAAKIDEWDYQCVRLGELANDGTVNRSEAATVLQDIALAHDIHIAIGGLDIVTESIACAFTPEEAAA